MTEKIFWVVYAVSLVWGFLFAATIVEDLVRSWRRGDFSDDKRCSLPENYRDSMANAHEIKMLH